MLKVMLKTGKRGAFTLVELLIVIVIIGILAVAAMMKYGSVAESAHSAEAYSVLAEIAHSESGFYTENNTFTLNWSDLDRFDSAPSSDNFTYTLNGGYYGKATPRSGKGNISYYMCFNGTGKGTDVPSCPSGL